MRFPIAPRRPKTELSFFPYPTKSPGWGLVSKAMEVFEFLLMGASAPRLQGVMETPDVCRALLPVCVCVPNTQEVQGQVFRSLVW